MKLKIVTKACAVVDENGYIYVGELGQLSLFTNEDSAQELADAFNGTAWAKREGKTFKVSEVKVVLK